jgi:hypothetical protein
LLLTGNCTSRNFLVVKILIARWDCALVPGYQVSEAR